MKIVYSAEAADHIAYWRKKDQKIIEKIKSLLNSIQETPFEGIGKPGSVAVWPIGVLVAKD